MPTNATEQRDLTPPEFARRKRVATKKVLGWIRNGELRALNVANRGCTRPRYVIPRDAIEEFERARTVVPDGGMSTTQRLRRRANRRGVKEFF